MSDGVVYSVQRWHRPPFSTNGIQSDPSFDRLRADIQEADKLCSIIAHTSHSFSYTFLNSFAVASPTKALEMA